MSRYVVTEIEGYLHPAGGASRLGVSCHVIDTAWNHRMLATYRSEDTYGALRHAMARSKAAEHAARLNELYG